MPKRYLQNFAPRWIIFCCDIILISACFSFSFFLVNNLSIDKADIYGFWPAVVFNIVIGTICFSTLSIYKGIIRYSELKDVIRIIKFAFLQFGCWSAVYLINPKMLVTATVTVPLLLINLFVVIFVLVSFRLLVKEIYFRAAQNKTSSKHRTLIFGAGIMGQITKRVIEQDNKMNTTLVGFIDDSYYKIGKKIGDLTIYNAVDPHLTKLIQDKGITQIYIAINQLSVERKIALADVCAPFKIKINVVPHANQWSGGLFQKNQVREMNIEELLQRDEIIIPNNLSGANYQDATILVTGAAGSIGSEICRQLTRHKLSRLIMLDQSESGLFDLEYELRQTGFTNMNVEVASAKDYQRLKKIFSTYNPTVVFHVAAYKHVPLMEEFPSEAVLTNIFGTKVVADLSVLFSVKTFVLVSTDKAVNPTNVMGATKRISEIYIQSLNDRFESNTNFITTRFGNVLGSAGSVVATFKKQIAEGGPITITHPDITRYFMTIPEAAKLVLEAGKIGKTGDILVFDMGKPVKVLDLANRMIQLAGYVPGKDIAIKYTQLRPGEKMYEELFKDSEQLAATDHPKILRAKKATNQNPEFYNLLTELQETAKTHNNEAIIKLLSTLLPEFAHAPNQLRKTEAAYNNETF
ncbi:MAG TPA: nucleoside-diphosphate sugar epimerase/dehydratase [Ferruginibacter sp.]|nr:nucleoside-diphosphate sugar epimerase/dehydratase [Ferruginibacter sp.]HPH90285.1 nucleoside-diphosphate sugar epimerase/dehydratase [Ferruginibacter sp.]